MWLTFKEFFKTVGISWQRETINTVRIPTLSETSARMGNQERHSPVNFSPAIRQQLSGSWALLCIDLSSVVTRCNSHEDLRFSADFVGYVDDTCAWLTIAPAIIFLVGLCVVPPSPRYQAITGKPHTAKKLLLVYRINTVSIEEDVDIWLHSKDVFGLCSLTADSRNIKLYLPVLGLTLLELMMGPGMLLFYLQEICLHICKSRLIELPLGRLPGDKY